MDWIAIALLCVVLFYLVVAFAMYVALTYGQRPSVAVDNKAFWEALLWPLELLR